VKDILVGLLIFIPLVVVFAVFALPGWIDRREQMRRRGTADRSRAAREAEDRAYYAERRARTRASIGITIEKIEAHIADMRGKLAGHPKSTFDDSWAALACAEKQLVRLRRFRASLSDDP
jgi:hypothetical protein